MGGVLDASAIRCWFYLEGHWRSPQISQVLVVWMYPKVLNSNQFWETKDGPCKPRVPSVCRGLENVQEIESPGTFRTLEASWLAYHKIQDLEMFAELSSFPLLSSICELTVSSIWRRSFFSKPCACFREVFAIISVFEMWLGLRACRGRGWGGGVLGSHGSWVMEGGRAASREHRSCYSVRQHGGLTLRGMGRIDRG